MKAFFAGLTIFFMAHSSQALAGQRPKLCGDMMRIQSVLEDARVMAAELRGIASAQKDYITRRELSRKAAELTRLVKTLKKELSILDQPVPSQPVPNTQVAPVLKPMTSSDFQKLLSALKSESFEKGKLRWLQGTVANNNFTVDQAKKVMRIFSFANGKVQAAAMMYDKILDKNDFYKVYEELTFDSDKEKLKKMITKQPGAKP